MCTHPNQRGSTLIELIMFIVIVSVAMAGIMLAMNQTVGHSADTMLRKQALASAESLLEEIERLPFARTCSVCSPTQANRPNFVNILDYHGYNTGASGIMPADGTTTEISGLKYYVAAVSAVLVTTPAPDPIFANIPAANTVQITVTVTDPAGQSITLTGYRTSIY